MERWSASPFCPPIYIYRAEKGRTLGKTLGTHWELEGNMFGTQEN